MALAIQNEEDDFKLSFQVSSNSGVDFIGEWITNNFHCQVIENHSFLLYICIPVLFDEKSDVYAISFRVGR